MVAYASHCKATTYESGRKATYWGLCSSLHMINLVDGRRFSIPAPTGTLGWVPDMFNLNSPIAPDATVLAAQAAASAEPLARASGCPQAAEGGP